MFTAEGLDHIAIHVQHLDRSIAWYRSVLGLEERERYRDTTGWGKPAVLCSGSGCVALFPTAPKSSVTPLQGHIAYRLNRENFAKAREHLSHSAIDVEYVEYAKVHSMYFFDPDGYQIELSTWEL